MLEAVQKQQKELLARLYAIPDILAKEGKEIIKGVACAAIATYEEGGKLEHLYVGMTIQLQHDRALHDLFLSAVINAQLQKASQ